MKISAIIPARGGSKGIPRKNLVDLGGLPLIAWSILIAKTVDCIDDVFVSTDSMEIARTARQFGAKVPFLRPPELASDTSTTVDAVADMLSKLGDETRPDVVVLLQPTQPFRTCSTVVRTIEKCLSTKRGALTVSAVNENPILMRILDPASGRVRNLLPNVSSTIRRQNFPKIFKVNGAVYANFSQDYFSKASLNDNPFAVETSPIEAVDIDEPSDLDYARCIIQRKLIVPSDILKG